MPKYKLKQNYIYFTLMSFKRSVNKNENTISDAIAGISWGLGLLIKNKVIGVNNNIKT